MSRSRARQARRRRGLVALAAAALVAAGTASAFGMRACFLDRGFIGLPPQEATPSTPESGELEIFYWVHSPQLRRPPTGPWDGNLGRSRAWVYADGQLIWLREADLPEGANRFSTGFLEQRLTPEGVELLRSEIVSTGVFEHDHPPLGSEPLPFSTEIQVRRGDRFVPVAWASDRERLEARLTEPASWLPANAWEDREIRAYVPSRFAVCHTGVLEQPSKPNRLIGPMGHVASQLLRQQQPSEPSRIFTLLPAAAQDRLRGSHYCSDVTTEEARALAEALDDAGLEQGGAYNLNYHFEAPGPIRETVVINFEPYLPHGETTCSACG